MEAFAKNEYRLGRHLFISLPAGSELISALNAFCKTKEIKSACFSIIGTVSFATIGVFDPKQLVFVTHVEKTATEMLSCMGNITPIKGTPQVTAKIILADQQGRLTGGHLFSETIVSHAEIDIQELWGEPLKRSDPLHNRRFELL
jgi:predicted DNA-binding protein with PD1-like motif